MAERQFGRIDIFGKGELKITTRGTTVIIKENAAPRKILDNGNPEKKKKEVNYPEGTIESLRPLLRGVVGADLTENADSYWVQIDSMATMTPKDAANKLKRAGIGRKQAAEILIMSDPLVSSGLGYHNFTQEQVDEKIAEVSNMLQPIFRNK